MSSMRISKSFCIGCVKAYRYTLAPIFMSLGVRCRFVPSCSEYATQSLEKHGAFRGFVLMVLRLLRCHPFVKGGYDPVVKSEVETQCKGHDPVTRSRIAEQWKSVPSRS